MGFQDWWSYVPMKYAMIIILVLIILLLVLMATTIIYMARSRARSANLFANADVEVHKQTIGDRSSRSEINTFASSFRTTSTGSRPTADTESTMIDNHSDGSWTPGKKFTGSPSKRHGAASSPDDHYLYVGSTSSPDKLDEKRRTTFIMDDITSSIFSSSEDEDDDEEFPDVGSAQLDGYSVNPFEDDEADGLTSANTTFSLTTEIFTVQRIQPAEFTRTNKKASEQFLNRHYSKGADSPTTTDFSTPIDSIGQVVHPVSIYLSQDKEDDYRARPVTTPTKPHRHRAAQERGSIYYSI